MPNPLGFAAYVSSFDPKEEIWVHSAHQNAPVFLSLHISEEFSDSYCERVSEICNFLYENGYRIIADVSPKTAVQFQENNLLALAKHLHIWALRVDYGFSLEEICRLAKEMPVVLNASTTTEEDAKQIASAGSLVMAMHNFYPRQDSGLDAAFFLRSTKMLQEAGLRVLAFIPGDTALRGPLHEGLPTLEHHRFLPPSVAFAELILQFGIDEVFLGDPGISSAEKQRIDRFVKDGILEIPAYLDATSKALYGRVFTCRMDSPQSAIRFAESREYSCTGISTAPHHWFPRSRGVITIDNTSFGRYSGEVQLVREDLPPSHRVNVIGCVAPGYLPLADCIQNGAKFLLTNP